MPSMTCAEYVKVIGRCYGKRVTNAEVDYILWNHTGFPSFWPSGVAPRQTLRHQVAEYFKGIRSCQRCGAKITSDIEVQDELCAACWWKGWWR